MIDEIKKEEDAVRRALLKRRGYEKMANLIYAQHQFEIASSTLYKIAHRQIENPSYTITRLLQIFLGLDK